MVKKSGCAPSVLKHYPSEILPVSYHFTEVLENKDNACLYSHEVLVRDKTRALLSTSRSYTTVPLTIATEENGIRRIVLNNPKKRNALSFDMLTALQNDITKNIHSDSLRVIIISAIGPVFSAGHDLKELTSTKDRSKHAKIFGLCSNVMELIQDIPVPVLCEVDGFATAAGCQLVASCDISVASEKSTFCTPGVNVGLFCSTPAVALGRSVPRKLALDMLFTGDIISAEKALLHGLVSRVVPSELLSEETDKIVKNICEKSRSVIALGKASFYRQIVKDRNSAYMDASTVMVENLSLQDAHEGISAFLDKRKPTWNHKFE